MSTTGTSRSRRLPEGVTRARTPAGRSGQPVRGVSTLRRVWIACHGWVRDRDALMHEHIWCTRCADWSRVQAVVE